MSEALVEGLFLVLQWKALAFMMLGVLLGFWVGLLPGLGGATTLALMLPFIYTMQPVEAFAFLGRDYGVCCHAFILRDLSSPTPAVSRAQKRERRRSGRFWASAPVPYR